MSQLTVQAVQIVKNGGKNRHFARVLLLTAHLPDNFLTNYRQNTGNILTIEENLRSDYHFNPENCRWDTITGEKQGFRLLCSHETCSLSTANLRKGFLSITSVHGSERHTHILSEEDRMFLILETLPTLSAMNLYLLGEKVKQYLRF